MHTNESISLTTAATLPRGFRAAGTHCGIKPSALDLALFVSDVPASIAGTFTTNGVQAAPVRVCRERLTGGKARAVVANSGNANACTGESGLRDAYRMAARTAELLGLSEHEVFVSSTGPIGISLPMAAIECGIHEAVQALSANGGESAAHAIMTTDTVPKYVTMTLDVDGRSVRITGIAKGSGMIHPGMATMLCYLLTDAAIGTDSVQACLSEAVQHSFNRITVDGDQSTNDTVLCLANGTAQNIPLHQRHADWKRFAESVQAVAIHLARSIVEDGEGASKLVTVHVRGGVSPTEADRVARAIANSLLIKTSWAGSDPNWGRIMCAVGYSGASIEESKIDIYYDDLPAVQGGIAANTPVHALRSVVGRKAFTIRIELHQGSGEAEMYACDTTEAYVRINVEE